MWGLSSTNYCQSTQASQATARSRTADMSRQTAHSWQDQADLFATARAACERACNCKIAICCLAVTNNYYHQLQCPSNALNVNDDVRTVDWSIACGRLGVARFCHCCILAGGMAVVLRAHAILDSLVADVCVSSASPEEVQSKWHHAH